MAATLAHRSRGSMTSIQGEGCSLSVSGSSNPDCLIDGRVTDEKGKNLSPEEFAQYCRSLDDPSKLNVHGAFAAVVRVGKSWWLIRDRMGMKPLYYAECSTGLIFASELKAILASGLVPKHINLAGVDQYLTLRCVPGEDSIIQGVKRVQPGHVLVYQNKVTQTAFARFDLASQRTTRPSAAHSVRALLRSAIERTSSNTVLWSAGIDCAAIGALKEDSDALFVDLKAWQNEAWRAKESARLMHIKLQSRPARRLSQSMVEDAAYYLDEPIADASIVPLWMVAEQVGGSGESFLSGHGADDILGGHTRYNLLRKVRGAKRLVPVSFLSGILPALPPNAFLRRGGRYLTSIDDNLQAYLSLLAVFDQGERNELYTDAMKAAIFEKGGSTGAIKGHFSDPDINRNLLALDLNVVIPNILLAQCDRLMAAHGVSLELPFLDDALVDFAISLPSTVKYGVPSKPVLRQAMKGLLPGRIRLRARRGFHVPQSGSSFRVLELAARAIVSQERVEASGLFKWPYVSQVLTSATHNIYRRRQFWALLMFFAWYRRFMET